MSLRVQSDKTVGNPTKPHVLALAAALYLTACQDSPDVVAAPSPRTLCVSSSCGSKTRLVTIPDAENILFTPAGRLFVSGGVNVYEISQNGTTYSATPLLDGSCNFTGLALRGEVLYANCFNGQLYAAQLTAAPRLQAIHALGLSAPNGLAAGPDGALYLVNGPLASSALPDPKIVRLKLDASDPFRVTEQTNWLTLNPMLSQPNGLQVRARTLYFSESSAPTQGRIQTVAINADGSPGTPQVFTSFNSLPDDFSFAGDGLLTAYYSAGQIALFDGNGVLVSTTDTNSFESPSQVRLGQPPLFAATDVLVTEKGVIGDRDSTVGNVLTVFRRN